MNHFAVTNRSDCMIEAMIALARCSKLQRIIVAGSNNAELMFELERRGYVHAAATANRGRSTKQYDVALVDWRRRTLRALEMTLDWLVDFLSPGAVLASGPTPRKQPPAKTFSPSWKSADLSLRMEPSKTTATRFQHGNTRSSQSTEQRETRLPELIMQERWNNLHPYITLAKEAVVVNFYFYFFWARRLSSLGRKALTIARPSAHLCTIRSWSLCRYRWARRSRLRADSSHVGCPEFEHRLMAAVHAMAVKHQLVGRSYHCPATVALNIILRRWMAFQFLRGCVLPQAGRISIHNRASVLGHQLPRLQ